MRLDHVGGLLECPFPVAAAANSDGEKKDPDRGRFVRALRVQALFESGQVEGVKHPPGSLAGQYGQLAHFVHAHA